jgi:hypothetical protein
VKAHGEAQAELSPYTSRCRSAEAKEASLTQAALGTRITQLEGALAKISDMTELTRLELQAESAKQQQLMQTLSAISKSFHDTSKAIISNLKS